MDYEKKCKELVAKIKNAHLYAQTDSTKNVLEGILPELAESEDERIRKAIISGMTALKEQGKETFAAIHIDDCIVWLEKQDKKNSVTTKEEGKAREQVVYAINKLNVPESEKNKLLAWLEKQGEPTDNDMVEALRTEYEKGKADAFAEMQKEWSEDDEKRLQSCINILKAKSLMGKVDTANTMWLKSLKQRIGG